MRLNSKPIRFFAAVASPTLALALTACGGTTATDDGAAECTDDADCTGAGEVCDGGECKKLCSDDDDCGSGEYCNTSTGFCEEGGTAECSGPGDCDDPSACEFGENAACDDGDCVYVAMSADTPCDDDDPCTVNDRCDGSGVCVGTDDPDCVIPDSCTGDGDCDLGEECVDDLCKKTNGETCTSNVQCVNTCIAGTCAALAGAGGSCEEDEDCETSLICGSSDTCVKANGADCTGDTECNSGHCADDVCCDLACDDPCSACDVNPGTCSGLNSGSCDDLDACTHTDTCSGGYCTGTSYPAGDPGECPAGQFCCDGGSGTLTCEGSSATCPGGIGGLMRTTPGVRYAQLNTPGASLYVY